MIGAWIQWAKARLMHRQTYNVDAFLYRKGRDVPVFFLFFFFTSLAPEVWKWRCSGSRCWALVAILETTKSHDHRPRMIARAIILLYFRTPSKEGEESGRGREKKENERVRSYADVLDFALFTWFFSLTTPFPHSFSQIFELMDMRTLKFTSLLSLSLFYTPMRAHTHTQTRPHSPFLTRSVSLALS